MYFPSWAPRPTSLIVVFWLPNFCTVCTALLWVFAELCGGRDDLLWFELRLFGSVVHTLITLTRTVIKLIVTSYFTYLAFPGGCPFSRNVPLHPLSSPLNPCFCVKAFLTPLKLELNHKSLGTTFCSLHAIFLKHFCSINCLSTGELLKLVIVYIVQNLFLCHLCLSRHF